MAGNENSGRTPNKLKGLAIQTIIDGTAQEAAQRIDSFVRQKKNKKRLNTGLQRACEYVIDHAIGKARLKIEHSGGILSYSALAKSAGELDKKPRDILADVRDLVNRPDVLIPDKDTVTNDKTLDSSQES